MKWRDEAQRLKEENQQLNVCIVFSNVLLFLRTQ